MDLRGKIAHVTAAAAGIGRGIAERLAREGASVVVSDIAEEWGPETVVRIEEAGGRAEFVLADATVEEDVRTAIPRTKEAFGGLDVLVNNAGGAPAPYFPEAPPEHWLASIALNLHSAMLATYYGIEAMRERGGGSILNVSSMAGIGFAPPFPGVRGLQGGSVAVHRHAGTARDDRRHTRQLHLPRLGRD